MSNLFDLDVCDISVPTDKDTQIKSLIASLPVEANEAKVALEAKEAKVALQQLQELRVQGMM